MKYSKYNVVIIGSGISGLYLANKLAESSDYKDGILVVTKEQLFSGSSALAQGGIVSVIPEINKSDSIESHINDTIKAGCGLNDLNTVKFVSESSSLAAQELIRFGVEFDKDDKNNFNFALEGAHSHPRILHSQGDSTGRVIEKTLCSRLQELSNVELYDNTMALELLVDGTKTCRGVVVYNWQNNYYEAVYSNNVVIATGGVGQLYKNTTNPHASTGDGIALAYRAGAKLENMEFVQFHPTALYCKDKKTMPLVSESARGEGAKLTDINGLYFAKNYNHLADLAPRDVVSRAIVQHCMSNNLEHVYLDISLIGIEKFKQRFPTITSLCRENNVDISNGLIPVIPAEHYFMGGIKTDIYTKTSVKNLYAIGECASTGLHGANRLASNSLLECAVFAHQLFNVLKSEKTDPPKKNDEFIKRTIDKYSFIESSMVDDNQFNLLFDRLKNTMTNNVGIIRTKESLLSALQEIASIKSQMRLYVKVQSRVKYELLNALCCADLIARAALERQDSIGSHYRADSIDNKNKNKESIDTYEELLHK